ncbi:MAG: uncharacterized protein A8A55_0341 [Amphiamblys sp. WSBS2006]|nr:MAG: uncharacterized protein A8A55_0341 [Amphiamblys sp. WSBS2006]
MKQAETKDIEEILYKNRSLSSLFSSTRITRCSLGTLAQPHTDPRTLNILCLSAVEEIHRPINTERPTAQRKFILEDEHKRKIICSFYDNGTTEIHFHKGGVYRVVGRVQSTNDLLTMTVFSIERVEGK